MKGHKIRYNKGRDAWDSEMMQIRNNAKRIEDSLFSRYKRKYPSLNQSDVIVISEVGLRVKGGRILRL